MDTHDVPAIVYEIDADDIIRSVNDEWLLFAEANGAPALRPDRVIDHSLWGFLTGWETDHLYRLLLDKVRATGTEVTIPFRCDSPNTRRYMEMVMRPLQYGGIQFESRTIRMEPRASIPLLDSLIEHGDSWATVCSWCKQIQTPEGGWDDLESSVVRQGFFNREKPPQLTHGVCPACTEQLHSELRRLPGSAA